MKCEKCFEQYGLEVEDCEFHAKEALEAEYGPGAWNTSEVQKEFEIVSFCAPFCVAVRRSDGVKGTLAFRDSPRLYYAFREI
jgi:hypothetical protein